MVLSTLGTTVKAQSYDFFSFGAKAGVNLSSVSGITDVEATLKAGFTGGLTAEIRPIQLIGVSIDALYASDGFNLEKSDFNEILNGELGYIDVPIMAKVYVWGDLSINAGIMPSFLVSSNIDLTINGVLDNDSNPIEADEVAFSIPVGISYKLLGFLTLEARYNIPISDMNTYTQSYIGTTLVEDTGYHLKRQAFSFMVGITF